MRAHANTLFSLFALILTAGLAGSAYGQAKPPASAPAQPAAQVSSIRMADIPLRADTDHRYAESVTERIAQADPANELASRLEAIARSTDETLQQFQPAELRSAPLLQLEGLARHWMFDARRLARWQADMQRATAVYASDAAELARRREAWQAIKNAPGAADLPPALMTRMDTVIAQLTAAEQAVAAPLARQVALDQRGIAVEARIQAGERDAANAIANINARLLQLDSAPLWEAGGKPIVPGEGVALLLAGLHTELHFAREYATTDSGDEQTLHVLQVLLLPLLLWLAWRSRRTIRAHEMSATAARVLGRPISTWLLLTMMGVLLLEPDTPLIVQRSALLLAVVPVLRLLPPAIRQQFGLWPYAITGLYLIERLGVLLLANETWYRLHNLGLTLLALVIVPWLLFRGRQRADPASWSQRQRVLRAIAWNASVLLAVSAVSNVVGNVSLAEMLTSAIISSGYFGLMLYSGVTIIITLLQLLLARPGVSRFRIAREHAPPLVQLLIRLVTAGAIIGWAVYTMDRFRVLRSVYAAVSRILSYTLSFGNIALSLGDVLVFVVSVLIAFWAARLIRLVLQDEVLSRISLPRGVGNSISSLTYYAVLMLGLAVALSAAGVKASQLAIVLGALGVGIGFGLQNVVNNFVSGLILMFERPIQPGDVVEIAGTSGQVRDIGMRATRIKTADGADVVVPNGTLLSEKLTNWTMLDRNRRIEINLGLGCDTNPAQAIELLTEAARKTPGVSLDPAPSALFMGIGSYTLDFSLRAWTSDFDHWTRIRSDLLALIHEMLTQAGIEIPFPQSELRLRGVSDDAGAALSHARRHATSQAPNEPATPA